MESVEVKKQIFRELDGDRRPGGDPGDQHLVAVGHRHLHRQRPARPGHRRPLLQPGAGPGPGRDHPHRRHRGAGARRRLRAGAPGRQEPGRLRRQGRLHRQHAAVRLPQPRGRDVRGQVRLPRGHRRRDAVRLRLPDGPAPAARPDRPRHGVRDPRDDVPAGPRPPARAVADPQADGHRRHARPQDGPRLLHLRGPGQPQDRGRRPHAVGRRPAAAAAPDLHGRRRRDRHHGERHRRGVRQGRLRRAVRRPVAGQGRRRGHGDHQELRPPDPARPGHRGRQGGGPGQGLRQHVARRPQGRRHRRRGDRRGPRR